MEQRNKEKKKRLKRRKKKESKHLRKKDRIYVGGKQWKAEQKKENVRRKEIRGERMKKRFIEEREMNATRPCDRLYISQEVDTWLLTLHTIHT